MTTDGYAINAGGWYKNAVLTVPITNADLDVNGCYQNPYVALDFGYSSDVNYTGAATARYFALQGLDEISDGTDTTYDGPDDKQPIVSSRNVYSEPLSLSLPALVTQAIQSFISETTGS